MRAGTGRSVLRSVLRSVPGAKPVCAAPCSAPRAGLRPSRSQVVPRPAGLHVPGTSVPVPGPALRPVLRPVVAGTSVLMLTGEPLLEEINLTTGQKLTSHDVFMSS